MSDRTKAFTVELDVDLSEEATARLVEAIQCLKHVTRVLPVTADWETEYARERARQEIREQLMDVLFPWRKTK